MGIFDFFKKKRVNIKIEDVQPANLNILGSTVSDTDLDKLEKERAEDKVQTETEEASPLYRGNLEHTALVKSLLETPKENRGDDWVISFLSHVATASFICGEPQVIEGPDKFPYFQIFLPKPATSFQCYVIENMIEDFLLENGFGVALEPKGNEVEWVLTYGDLLHYSVHKTFAYPTNHAFVKYSNDNEVLDVNEQVLVGAPSESILPAFARKVIKSFLQTQGVEEPKVCLINRQEYSKGQHLVFNIVPWQFESEAHYQSVLRALGWFLPGYYSFIGVKEDLFKDGFLPL